MEIPITNKIHEEISVFETLRSYSGKILGLEEHLIRLEESAKTLSLPTPATRGQIQGEINRQLELAKGKDILIRPTVFKGGLVFFVVPVPQIKKDYYERALILMLYFRQLENNNAL